MKHCRNDEPERMLDLMICASLIEARSCERMSILAEALVDVDPKLAQFYRGLLACEARHHQIYIDMLQEIYDKDVIAASRSFGTERARDCRSSRSTSPYAQFDGFLKRDNCRYKTVPLRRIKDAVGGWQG